MKYTPIDDEKKFKELTEAVKANGGYCPCIIARNEDTRCPCKHFREEVRPGKLCICGRYVKLEM